MDWKSVLNTLAPTVATALGGPLGGSAVVALGQLLGISEPTQDRIRSVIEQGQMTGQQIADLKALEMKLQAEEQERGFRYADLEFRDRDSARGMQKAVPAKTPAVLTWLIVLIVLGMEGALMFGQKPVGVSEIVLGRILGTLDTALMMVLAFWFGTTYSSSRKTDLLSTQASK